MWGLYINYKYLPISLAIYKTYKASIAYIYTLNALHILILCYNPYMLKAYKLHLAYNVTFAFIALYAPLKLTNPF